MMNSAAQELGIPPGMGKKVVWIVIVFAAFMLLAGSFGTVEAGERGVLLRFGEVVEGGTKEPGLYLKVPFMDRVVILPTQIQKYTAPATSSSK
ncbi:MAG: SPFH domain-containing protein, partial [Acidobacteria bacterium]|nr:SPFH domain-containing protein [Acidobacteriota bacterium]